MPKSGEERNVKTAYVRTCFVVLAIALLVATAIAGPAPRRRPVGTRRAMARTFEDLGVLEGGNDNDSSGAEAVTSDGSLIVGGSRRAKHDRPTHWFPQGSAHAVEELGQKDEKTRSVGRAHG